MHTDFAEGYTDPLAMMGVALDRYLPGRNAMLANEAYVVQFSISLLIKSNLECEKSRMQR